jgi:MFS family permease
MMQRSRTAYVLFLILSFVSSSPVQASSRLKLRATAPTKLRSRQNKLDLLIKATDFPEKSVGSFSFQVLLGSTFLLVLGGALPAFAPVPALVERLGTERATHVLSSLSSGAALGQIIASPLVGSLMDAYGRKLFLITSCLAVVLSNATVAIYPTVYTICGAKAVGMVALSIFFIATQTMLSDLYSTDPTMMSSAIGLQSTVLSAGFMGGVLVAGRMAEKPLQVMYALSALMIAVGTVVGMFGLRETLTPSSRVSLDVTGLQKLLITSPLSSTKIFGHGATLSSLVVLLTLQSLPMQMGDTFQIYAKSEWGLETKTFASIIAMFSMIGVLGNLAGSLLVKRLGIKLFTLIATASSLLSPLGAWLFGFHGIVVGSLMGFLSAGQSQGITAALMSEGSRLGISRGTLAGERASLVALLKVVGPIWYSSAYMLGKKHLNVAYLPFIFNLCVATIVLLMSQIYLS